MIAEHLIHVMLKDEGPDEYEVGEFGMYTDTGILFVLYSQEAEKGWVLDKNKLATLLLAIDITLTHACTDNIEFGSVEFISPPATYERKGIVQFADQESVLTSKHDQVHTVVICWASGLLDLTAEAIKLDSNGSSALLDANGVKVNGVVIELN